MCPQARSSRPARPRSLPTRSCIPLGPAGRSGRAPATATHPASSGTRARTAKRSCVVATGHAFDHVTPVKPEVQPGRAIVHRHRHPVLDHPHVLAETHPVRSTTPRPAGTVARWSAPQLPAGRAEASAPAPSRRPTRAAEHREAGERHVSSGRILVSGKSNPSLIYAGDWHRFREICKEGKPMHRAAVAIAAGQPLQVASEP